MWRLLFVFGLGGILAVFCGGFLRLLCCDVVFLPRF